MPLRVPPPGFLTRRGLFASSSVSWSCAGSFLLALWRVLAASAPGLSPFPFGGGAQGGAFALTLALSPVRERELGGSCDPRPIYSWFLPLTREMSLPCKAVTPVLASRMPTSIARRHWGCSPSSNFPGRLTGPCGTACVSRLDLPPAKASGCAGYGPPGRPRVRTWNGGGAFGTASSWGGAETQSDLLIPRGPRPNNSGGMNAQIWQRWVCARLVYAPSGRLPD